jgi:transposase
MSNVPVFVGLDYHQDSVQVCVLDRQGRRLLNRACPNDWGKIAEAVEPLGRVERAAVEACCGAADLSEELRSRAGWPLDLAHPGYVERMKRSPDKSDFTDGHLIADLCRVGYVPKVHLPSSYERDLRQLVNHRQSLVDQRRAAKLRVGAVLREHRAGPPKKCPRWARAWVAWARSAPELSAHARWVVAELLGDIEHLDKRVLAADARLRGATEGDPLVARLMNEPGVVARAGVVDAGAGQVRGRHRRRGRQPLGARAVAPDEGGADEAGGRRSREVTKQGGDGKVERRPDRTPSGPRPCRRARRPLGSKDSARDGAAGTGLRTTHMGSTRGDAGDARIEEWDRQGFNTGRRLTRTGSS